jgi:hypothetical protein
MPLTSIAGPLIVAGVLLWLVNSYVPMSRTIKKVINIVAAVGAAVWLLVGFGALGR